MSFKTKALWTAYGISLVASAIFGTYYAFQTKRAEEDIVSYRRGQVQLQRLQVLQDFVGKYNSAADFFKNTLLTETAQELSDITEFSVEMPAHYQALRDQDFYGAMASWLALLSLAAIGAVKFSNVLAEKELAPQWQEQKDGKK